MKKLIATVLMAFSVTVGHADTTTTRLGLIVPTIGSSGWGAKLNSDLNVIDSSVAALGQANTFTAPATFTSSMTVASSMTVVNMSAQTVQISSNAIMSGATFYNGGTHALGTIVSGTWNGTRLTSSYIPTDVAYIDAANTFSSSQTFTSALGNKFSSMTLTGVLVANSSIGTLGQVLTSQGNAASPQWTTVSASAGGSTGQIQYNNAGSLAGVPSTVTASSVTISTVTAILGTITNNAAAMGYVGEFIMSTGTANTNASASGVFDDLASAPLTAGDWQVTGGAQWDTNGNAITQFRVGVSTTSGNSEAGLNEGDTQNSYVQTIASGRISMFVPAVRFSLATSTTVYLKRMAAYAGSAPRTISFGLRATRIR